LNGVIKMPKTMKKKKLKNLKDVLFHELIKLYSNQQWLLHREEQLLELMELCEAEDQRDLIISLLEEFRFISDDYYSFLLEKLAEHIVNNTGFTEKTTQIVACTRDEEADSGQKILDQLKFPLFHAGWKKVKTVNRLGDSIRNHKKGYTQIVLIDEFIGSGKTLNNRIRELQNDIGNHFDLKCCFLVGMSHAVQSLQRSGFDIFCPLLLQRGISSRFEESKLVSAILNMKNLEKKLAPHVYEKDLRDYSFGYERSETLYSLEGCKGNTPNNVFPIFWWPRDSKNRDRNNILTRYEKGFYNVENDEN
jgi:hypothetical protein